MRVVGCLILAGCTNSATLVAPLDEAPIEGGTAGANARVQRVVAQYALDVDPSRLHLARVVLGPAADARYDHTERTVFLNEDAPLLDVEVVYRLTHALVRQDGLLDVADGSVDWMRELFEEDARFVDPNAPRDVNLRETIAEASVWGPMWAHDVLHTTCFDASFLHDDWARSQRLATWMLRNVWAGFSSPEPLDVTAHAIEVDVRGEIDAIFPTTNPEVVRVVMEDGTSQPVMVATGARVAVDPPLVEEPAGLPKGLHIYFGGDPSHVAGWPDGPAVVSGNWIPGPQALSSGVRVFAHDGTRWRSVIPCELDSKAFVANGHAWMAWRGPDWDWRWHWAPVGATSDP